MKSKQTNSGGITGAMARMTELENSIHAEKEEKEREEAVSKSLQIKTHNFDKATKALELFLEETEGSVHLSNVEVDGLIPIFDHNVTGRELNRLIEQLKEAFISFNQKHTRTTKEIRQVYEALEALDNDYITAIVANIEAIAKTSHEAKMIAKKTSENTAKIDKTIQAQKKTLEALGQFKERLDKQKELDNLELLIAESKLVNQKLKVATTISAVSMVVAVVSVALHFVGI